MPITINYNPAAEALANVAYLAGQGQFRQREDVFGLDVAQLGERQRQFDIGTRLNVAQLGQRERERISRERSQIFDQIGRERLALFDALQRQQLQQQAIAADAMQQQQQIQQADQQRLAAIQNERRDMAFRQRQAQIQQIDEAFAKRQITPDQRAEAYGQIADQYAPYGLPPVGAAPLPPPPNPMDQMQSWAEGVNQTFFGGQPVVSIQPDGKPFVLPHQSNPVLLEQDHQATLETNREKAQQAQELERIKQQAEAADAAAKRRADIQKEIDTLEANRREAIFGAMTADNPAVGAQDVERSWNNVYGRRLESLRRQLQTLGRPSAEAPPPAPAPVQGTGPAVNPGGTYPNLPPVIGRWDQTTADELVRAFMTSDAVGEIIGPQPQFREGRIAQSRMVDQWMQNLYRWTLEDGLPFVQDPGILPSLPAHSWFIGEDFLKHRVPGRAANALRGGVTDFVGSLTRANLQGLSDAALGLYDNTGP